MLKTVNGTLRHSRLLRVGLYVLLGVLLTTAVLTQVVVRLVIWPQLEARKSQIEQILSRELGVHASIGAIKTDWELFRPSFEIRDVSFKRDPLAPESSRNTVLQIPLISGILAWNSIWHAVPRFYYLSSHTIAVTALRDKAGLWSFAGVPMAKQGGDFDVLGWALDERNLSTENLQFTVFDDFEGDAVHTFTIEKFSLRNQQRQHWVELSAYVKPSQGLLNFSGDFHHKAWSNPSDWRNWEGEFSSQIRNINAANLLKISPLPIKSGSGSMNFDGKASLQYGILQTSNASLEAKNIDIIWANNQPAFRLHHLQIDAAQNGNSALHTIDFKNLQWTARPLDKKSHRIEDLNVQISPNKYLNNISKVELNVARIPLTELVQVAQNLPLAPSISKPLRIMQPEGIIEKLNFIWHKEKYERSFISNKFVQEEFKVSGKLNAVGWQAYQDILPSVKGLSGDIATSLDAGHFVFAPAPLTLASNDYLVPKQVKLPPMTGKLSWQKKDPQWAIEFEQLTLKDAATELIAQGSYLTAAQNLPDALDLKLQINKMSALTLLSMIPKTIAPTAVEYMRATVSQGVIENSTLILQGPTVGLPYPPPSPHRFSIDLYIKNAIYRPVAPNKNVLGDWLALDNVSARIQMNNHLLSVNAPLGKFKNVSVEDIQVVLDTAKKPNILEVKGRARGPLNEFLEYFVTTPVGYKWQSTLKDVTTSGNTDLNLELSHEFGEKEKTLLNTRINLANNQVQWGNQPAGEITNGLLMVNENGLKTADINGRMLGGEWSLKTNPLQENILEINADIDSKEALAMLAVNENFKYDFKKDLLTGRLGLQGSILQKTAETALSLNLNLNSTQINLPQPLQKKSGDALAGLLQLSINTSSNLPSIDWNVKLEKFLSSSGKLIEKKLRHATVQIGSNSPSQKPQGIELDVDVPTIALDEWLALIDQFETANPKYIDELTAVSADPKTPSLPIHVSAKSAQVLFLGREFTSLAMTAQTNANIWEAHLQTQHIDGHLRWEPRNQFLPLGALTGDFKTLHLPPPLQRKPPSDQLQSSLSSLPKLDVSITDFKYEESQIGELKLQAEAFATHWKIHQMSVKNPFGEISAHGQWDIPSGDALGKTHINLDLQTSNTGDYLSALGINTNVIDRGTGGIKGILHWQGSPIDFNTVSLQGDLQLDVKNGTIVQVDPGAAKLLGILSLQNLLEFATFNFEGGLGGAIRPGTPFDEITASATIRDGSALTEDFEMKSSLARITSRGNVNLNLETQDLRITIYPRINFGSAGLAAFYFVTPIIGISAMIGQYLFSAGINKAFQTDLLIQGSWDNPEIIPMDQSGKPVDDETVKKIRQKSLLIDQKRSPTLPAPATFDASSSQLP